MIQSELDDLWDQMTACLICGRVIWKPTTDDLPPLCDRCGAEDGGEE